MSVAGQDHGRASHANGTSSSSNGAQKAVVLNGSSTTGQNVANSDYHGHDREEVTRLLIQTLSDMGYETAAKSVSQASGFDLESQTVSSFRNAVLQGSWAEAEDLLSGAADPDEKNNGTGSGDGCETGGNGLVLAAGADKDEMRFRIREQKFLELLEAKDTAKALAVLRSELTPLDLNIPKLHNLSGLLMCQSAEEVKSKAKWDGGQGDSRRVLLSELSRCISPSVMLPEHRMATLLDQVKRSQVNGCLWHTDPSSLSLYADHRCDRSQFPDEVALQLSELRGEAWGVQFSHDGRRLAAWGSGDAVLIWDVPSFTLLHSLPDHAHGIANMSWSPNDSLIVSCAQDKYARIWDVESGHLIKKLPKFEEPVSGCVWAPDGQTFTTSSLDKEQSLRTWNVDGDLVHDWMKNHRVQDLCGSADGKWLVAVDNQFTVHLYNAVTREPHLPIHLESRPTSVTITGDSRFLLVNKRDGEAQLFDLVTHEPVQVYTGHSGGECLIRSSVGGANESFVLSGSEDGKLVIWHKNTGVIVEKLEGHHPRTNAVVWNPADPHMLASCGDDGIVKIWLSKSRGAALRGRAEVGDEAGAEAGAETAGS